MITDAELRTLPIWPCAMPVTHWQRVWGLALGRAVSFEDVFDAMRRLNAPPCRCGHHKGTHTQALSLVYANCNVPGCLCLLYTPATYDEISGKADPAGTLQTAPFGDAGSAFDGPPPADKG